MPIQLLVKGAEPTLLHADLGNQLINEHNAIANMSVEPPEAGRFEMGQDRATLVLNMDAFKGGGGGDGGEGGDGEEGGEGGEPGSGDGGAWEEKTIVHLGALATQLFRVKGAPTPI